MLQKVNFVLVTVLSAVAGVPKIMQVPSEAGFFASLGLESALVAFGLLQIGAAALLLIKKSRLWGALLAAALFLSSAAMLAVAGKTAFALVSVVPVILAALVAYAQRRGAGLVAENQ